MTQLSEFDLAPFSTLTQNPKNRRKRDWHEFDSSYGHRGTYSWVFSTSFNLGVSAWGGGPKMCL